MSSEGNTDDFHTFIIEMFCILFLIEIEPKLRGFVEQVMRALVLNAVSQQFVFYSPFSNSK